MIPIIKGGMSLSTKQGVDRPNGNISWDMFLQELLYLREQLILAAEPEKQIMPEKPRGEEYDMVIRRPLENWHIRKPKMEVWTLEDYFFFMGWFLSSLFIFRGVWNYRTSGKSRLLWPFHLFCDRKPMKYQDLPMWGQIIGQFFDVCGNCRP